MKKLFAFQSRKVDEIKDCITRMQNEDREDSEIILLHAPTGTGKTLMMSKVIMDKFAESCTFVFSPGQGGLNEQTQKAIAKNLDGSGRGVFSANDMILKGSADPGDVYVGNWEAFTQRDHKTGKEKNILTKNSERANFWDFLDETVKSGTAINVVIDESHYGKARSSKDTSRIQEFIRKTKDRIINDGGQPPIILEATATPIPDDNFIRTRLTVTVTYPEAMKSGLLRNHIAVNTGLGDEASKKEGTDAEHFLIDAALEKQETLARYYKEAGTRWVPLIGIQMRNNNRESQKTIVDYLAGKGITEKNGKLAIYLSDNKSQELSNISKIDSPVRVILYKQAISTGWDCPRAQILVGMRHIVSKVFNTQNLGRFLRTTEAKTYTIGDTPHAYELNSTYIYSNEKSFAIAQEINKLSQEGIKTSFDTRALRIPKQYTKFIEQYNSHNFPTSYAQQKGSGEIKGKDSEKIVEALNDAWEKVQPDFRITEITKSALLTGSAETSDFVKSGILDTTSTGLEFEDNEDKVNEDFSSYVQHNLRDGDGHMPHALSVFNKINKSLPRMIGRKISEFAPMDDLGVKRQLLESSNKNELERLLSEFCKNPMFGNGQESLLSYANEKLILSGGHHFKTDINISDSNGGIDYQKVKFCLYRDASNENTSFRVDPSKPSEPEKHFEDMITRDIGKGYELVAYFKNPPFASQSSFVVGIRLTVAYEEDGKIKRWNFWPDYFLIVRSVKDGSLRPVIVEIKGDTSMDPKPLLQAKVQAAQTYMEHTGLMFTVMKEGKEKGTFYSSMSGEDMPQFLDNNWNRKMLDFENIEYASEDGLPKELEWMKDIGLIDTDSDSAI